MANNEIFKLLEEIMQELNEGNLYDHTVKLSPELTVKRMKKLESRNKANDAEIKGAAKRELGDDSEENINKIYDKRCTNKTTKGEDKTRSTQTKYADGIRREKSPEQAVEASIKRNMGEALEILENVRQAIEKSDKSEQTKTRLHKELSDAQDLEYAHAAEQARKSWIAGERRNPDVMIVRSAEYTKNANGERKTRMRSGHYSPKTEGEKVAASIKRQDKKIKRRGKKTNEALDLLEQIYDYAENLFELDYEEKQNISPNKVSKVKKDKDGNEVEVVSVADELFPHEGNAKQQFNKKILDKINDMIEGSGSLEDLIQFVRKGAPVRKTAHESYEEAIKLLEAIVSEDKNIFGKETGKGDSLNDIDAALGSPVKKVVKGVAGMKVARDKRYSNGEIPIRGVSDRIPVDKTVMTKDSIKNAYKLAESLLEELINEVSSKFID